MSPTARAATAIAAVALSAIVLPIVVSLIAALALAAFIVVDTWWVRGLPDVEQIVPQHLSRGRPSNLRTEVHTAPGAVTQVRQASPADVEVVPSEAVGGLDATITARRRGRHELPAPATRVTGPLGLGAWNHSVGHPTHVRVYPDMPAAYRMVEAIRRSRFGDAGRRLRGPLGLGTDFESIRDYSPDDDIRQVNWRATARTGRPMSNQYRVEQDRDIICVVDAGRLMAAPFGDRTRLDAAVDAVAAIASVTNEMDDRCGLVVFDSSIRRIVTPNRRNALRIIEAVHDVEPSTTDSDYDLAFREVGGGKRSLVLVFTDLIEETAARPLLEAVGVLARRHAVIVVTARDYETEDIVGRSPRAVLDSYRSAVALDVLAARSRVTALLRNAGAEVIEAMPDDIGPAAVRAYLKAKGRARL